MLPMLELVLPSFREERTELADPPSSSFLGLPYRILNINHKEELNRGLWLSLLNISACVNTRREEPVCATRQQGGRMPF